MKYDRKGNNDMKSRRFILSLLIVVVIGLTAGFLCFRFFYVNTPERNLTTAMDSVVEQNRSRASRYLDYDALLNSIGERKISSAVMRDFQYSVKEIQYDGSSSEAAAVLVVSNRDMQELYGNFLMDAYGLAASNASKESARISDSRLKKKISEMLIETLENGEADIVESEITVEMLRRGRSWWINIRPEDYDALCGGYLSAQQEAVKTLSDLSADTLSKTDIDYSIHIDNPHYLLRNGAHFIVEDIWNQNLCNVVSAINAGTDQYGKEYDFKAGMETLRILMKQKKSFDTNIAAITDDKYADSVEAWKIMSNELDKLFNEMEQKNAKPMDFDYIPDTAKFEESMQTLVDTVYSIKK